MLNGPWRARIGFPNHALTASYTGGSWVSGDLALEPAMRDPLLGHVARSASADPAATVMDITLDRHRAISIASLVGSTISVSGQFRLTAWADAGRDAAGGKPIFDTGVLDAFPRIYAQGSIPWGEPNWWSLRPLAEDIGRVTALTPPVIMDTPVRARWWRMEILDPFNPFKFVDVGKLFLGGSLALPFNYSRGATLLPQDTSRMIEAQDGTRTYEQGRIRRIMTLPFQYLRMAEDFAMWFDFMVDAGTTKEVLLVPDPTDTLNLQRRSFVGVPRNPTAMEQALTGHFNAAVTIEEI